MALMGRSLDSEHLSPMQALVTEEVVLAPEAQN